MTTLKKKQLIGAIGCGLLVSVAAVILAWANPLQKSQEQLSNFLYYERPTKNPIVVIGIDNKSLNDAAGLGSKQAAWPRSYYAKVIKNILKYQPSSIGLDISFRNASEGIGKDDLARIIVDGNLSKIEEYANVDAHPYDVEFGNLITENSNIFVVDGVSFPKNSTQINLSDINLQSGPNLPYALFKGDKQYGHNSILSGLSGFVYTLIPDYKYEGEDFPAFSLKLAAAALGLANPSYEISEESIVLKSGDKVIDIPLQNSQLRINYSSKTLLNLNDAYKLSPITYIPFVDVYKEDYRGFDANYLKGKIVLIGAWYGNSGDNFPTPIDPQNPTYGVAIHAQAIQTILDQAWLYNQSLPWQAATIILLVALTLVMIFGLKIKWALPGATLLLLLYAMVVAPLSFRLAGIIVNLVYPPLAIILAAIVGYAYRYVTEFKQKNKVATALEQYTNTGVKERVLESDKMSVEKSAEKKEITVIFTDIRSFTTISEALQPQSIVALLNEYFEVMAGVVIANGGTVDKYEGDALMAYFEGADHQQKAAKAALGMRAELPKLLEKWRNDPPLPGGEKKPEIDFRVGVSTGEAVMGNIGSSQHIQYTVIGDIVNLGSRLESANKKYQTNVMVAEATFEAIKNHFECRFLDLIKVKGKNKAVKIYELLCTTGELPADQMALIQAYNKGLALYFNRQFAEAVKFFNEEVLVKWPRDYLSNVYAARSQKCVLFPPEPDWDFVFKMETK